MTDLDWHHQAACKNLPVLLFFPPEGERQAERDRRELKAKAVCHTCPVWRRCLEEAVERNDKHGIWGGHNPDERASARRRAQRRGLYEPRAADSVTVDAKPCRLCGETLPATAFHKDRRSSDGLNPSCKVCTNEAVQRRREAKQAVA